ncbi:MAG: polysaccharide deacetylase family protein [Flavobacteriia bacterium]|nr:polysaccharide deacetylase family protein [Flavobacteriia bacterium]
MLIFVEQISNRLNYVFQFVFKERNVYYQFTNDKKEFENYQGIKFVYASRSIEDNFHIESSSLLFDEQIKNYSIEKSDFHHFSCLSFDNISDPFASIFFVLSRYEEYLIKTRDVHGRFMAKESYQYKYSWLQQCICDRWSENILELINLKISPFYQKKETNVKLIPTFDIDNTFAFQWKNIFRSFLSKWKDIIKKEDDRIVARKWFEEGKIKDPYDTFDLIQSVQKKMETIVFWHVGKYGPYDKNISILDPRHQTLIKSMSAFGEIGIHPSYRSSENFAHLTNEVFSLQQILQKKITLSRQHFLKLSIPSTYRYLMEQGIAHDYSMGFADEVGFRIGTAKSIPFFDLIENKQKEFWIHPFAYMDGTLLEYKNWSTEEAKKQITFLYKEVKELGGDFIFIWHNETIGDFGKWKGWSEVLKHSLQLN